VGGGWGVVCVWRSSPRRNSTWLIVRSSALKGGFRCIEGIEVGVKDAYRVRRTEVRSLRATNEDFQFATFDTQSGTGRPAPLGTAIKINPKSLKDSAFLAAARPAPVYLSI